MSSDITLLLGKHKIKLCYNVINVLHGYIQKGFFSKESGGILIGKENISNENLIINHATIPMTEDKRTRKRFIRTDKGHIEVFNNLYKENAGTYRYIGEWHTHPESVPNYSSIDFHNWKKISKNSNGIDNFYHIIVGYEAIRIWEMNNNKVTPKLIGTIFWQEVL